MSSYSIRKSPGFQPNKQAKKYSTKGFDYFTEVCPGTNFCTETLNVLQSSIRIKIFDFLSKLYSKSYTLKSHMNLVFTEKKRRNYGYCTKVFHELFSFFEYFEDFILFCQSLSLSRYINIF